MTQPLAALTGGTGFLGSACAAALVRAGWRVRLLTRRSQTHPVLAGLDVEQVPGDLCDTTALARLVRGADAVVHAAGLVKAINPADFQTVNRDGTARLAAIVASEAPWARFILISSQAARGPALSPYAASKRAAEAALVDALPAGAWTILRPPVIYGPWDLEGIAVLRLARSRVVPIPRAPEPRLAMIHVRDAAAAVLALCAPGPARLTYEIYDGITGGHAWRDIVRAAADKPGHTPSFLPIPDAIITTAGRAADVWARFTGSPAIFGLGKAREILHRDWHTDAALLPPADLWTPTIGLTEGMRETVAWWRAQGGPYQPVSG